MGIPRPSAGGVALLLAAAALPAGAALAGARGPLLVTLNLGPGDGPYVSGFTPRWEVEEKVGTHWTTYDASIVLPLAASGGAGVLAYRFSRVLPQTAEVEVLVGGRAVDRFTCRGGAVLTRETPVALDGSPVRVSFKVDSHDRRNLGLRLDWVRLSMRRGTRLRLVGLALWGPAALTLVVALALGAAGWGLAGGAAAAAPLALALSAGLLLDPWLTHRLIGGVPSVAAALGLAGLGLARAARIEARALRFPAALAMAALLARAAAVNHPDFYYPDLALHGGLVELLRQAGLDFLRSPSAYLWGEPGAAGEAPRGPSGLWLKRSHEGFTGMPYSLAFHAPFALVPDPGFDALLARLKLAGVACSIVPLLATWALAVRLGLSRWGAGLMVLVPTYTSRLSYGLVPALFGHAWDVAFLLWLAGALERLGTPRAFAAGALLLAGAHLAYVSSVANLCLFLALLAFFVARESGVRLAGLVLAMGLAGSALAVGAYYRDFLGPALALAAQAAGGAAPAAASARESWLAVTYERTRDFFDGLYPILAVAGLALLWRRGGRQRALCGAWLGTYLLLTLLRAKAPDMFRYGHETLFVTPLVCLAAGEALARLAEGGRARRLLAAALLAALAVQGLALQWRAIAGQAANAL